MSRRKEKRAVAACEDEGGRRIPFRGGGGNGRRRRGGGGRGSSPVVGAVALSFSIGEGASDPLASPAGVDSLEPEVPPSDGATESTPWPGSVELAVSDGDVVAHVDVPAPLLRASWSLSSSSSS
jgi:hypothetical protein